jgi:hypothetical protein
MDFISLGRVENHCGSNSDMNVLVTTLHCVGSLDIKRFNAPNLLTELHQTNIVFHCRPSSCMGCVKTYHPLGMILIMGSHRWAPLTPTRKLNRVLRMELSQLSNSSLASTSLIRASTWHHLKDLKPCSLLQLLEFSLIRCCPLLHYIFMMIHMWHLPNQSNFYQSSFTLKWAGIPLLPRATQLHLLVPWLPRLSWELLDNQQHSKVNHLLFLSHLIVHLITNSHSISHKYLPSLPNNHKPTIYPPSPFH